MPIDASHLWRQLALGEDTDPELKEARFRADQVIGPRRDDLADDPADGLAALANGRGERLVLGVTDERRPQGLDPAQLDALADLVTEICSDSVKPPLGLQSVPGVGAGARGRRRRWSSSCRRARRCIVAGRAFPSPGTQETPDGCGEGPPAGAGAGAVGCRRLLGIRPAVHVNDQRADP